MQSTNLAMNKTAGWSSSKAEACKQSRNFWLSDWCRITNKTQHTFHVYIYVNNVTNKNNNCISHVRINLNTRHSNNNSWHVVAGVQPPPHAVIGTPFNTNREFQSGQSPYSEFWVNAIAYFCLNMKYLILIHLFIHDTLGHWSTPKCTKLANKTPSIR